MIAYIRKLIVCAAPTCILWHYADNEDAQYFRYKFCSKYMPSLFGRISYVEYFEARQ